MLDLFFADDSLQRAPTRDGMRPLISAGGVLVPSERVRSLERSLNQICEETGFPEGDGGEFKWSPGRELWMHRHLHEEGRERFFLRILDAAGEHGVAATVMVSDTDSRTATEAPDHPTDVTRLLLERVNTYLSYRGRDAAVVVDRPSGNRSEEDAFLRGCLETLDAGTTYVTFDRVAINVVSTPSKLVRCLQLADLATGCTTALVAGEDRYAPPIFRRIRPLLMEDGGRVGGVGLKIHPLMRYVNLYHWLLGDEYYRRRNMGWPLPEEGLPYSRSPNDY